MISVKEAEAIHKVLIDTFGGMAGTRDKDMLESDLTRPFQTFDNSELYATVIDKAAALIESICNNHPFVDGNKRTGYVLMRLFLLKNGLDILATQKEKYDLVINIASGYSRFDAIVQWQSNHTKK
jgi:death on curing protein